MSKSNRDAREKLIQLYGPECFIEKLHLRNDSGRRYSGKCQYCKMKQLTYHHVVMRCKGGKATVENGALLCSDDHRWFHLQDKKAQREMNQAFQEYKRKVDEARKHGKELEVVLSDDVHVPFEVRSTIIQPYNRTKRKRDDRRELEEYKDYEEGDER